jgi:hypothetical protein
MALPIAATPVLTGQDAFVFCRTIEEDLKKPTRLIPTPKLEAARKKIQQYASERKKQA